MTTETIEKILDVSNLTKIYGREIKLGKRIFGRRVVGAKNVNFSVHKGEIFGFLGPNGAGKTTTIRSILDYLRIQTGTITIFSLDHHKKAIEIRKRIGYIPDELGLYEDFTGKELINYLGHFRPADPEFLARLKTLFKVDLTLKIKSLSKGNQQQVALIAALAAKPDFLILDEPTSGLDPLMTVNFHQILKELREEGKTIFLSSHNLAEVQSICDRVAIIKDGEIILVEDIASLRKKFLQNVEIKFSSDPPKETEFEKIDAVISVERTNKGAFRLRIKENVNALLQLLTQYDLDRLTIEDATLEEIFLHYYE
ncbi:MAG: ATP-binding cassette domain-containing protein [Candidatus Heimdallarchaeota archaeon]|nr:ATP-binding cassette domain-containing protein [Candidatus Heimdallarchaeota archaeon]